METRVMELLRPFYNPPQTEWPKIMARPQLSGDISWEMIQGVFDDIAKEGDFSLKKYTKKFDGVTIEDPLISQKELEEAVKQVPQELKEAMQMANSNIEAFHVAQRTEDLDLETIPGVRCWRRKLPIQKVGLYIPGGTAPLFSTVLMLAIPAKLAGCEEIVLCTPPNRNGEIAAPILYAAKLAGVNKIYKAGGIQAIAAMAKGTESIPKVFKIFGPGNGYVTMAKQYAAQLGTAIDMPAGPSELLVLADDSANPAFVASDLLSQAEHGVDSQVILVSTSKALYEKVLSELDFQLNQLDRKDLARRSLENSKYVYFDDKKAAADFINEYAPEHYMICSRDEDFFLGQIKNAGSVFIGNLTPESAGDYASGTNHTLPTNGFAKQFSGVSLDSFMKGITFQKINEEGVMNLGRTVEVMAAAEGLTAHKNAMTLRIKEVEKNANPKP